MDYLSGPNLITQTSKSREFSLTEVREVQRKRMAERCGRRGSQNHSRREGFDASLLVLRCSCPHIRTQERPLRAKGSPASQPARKQRPLS
jgi:hypothetical protein